MQCPFCGSNNSIHAVYGKIKTVSCINCERGFKTGINGRTTKRMIVIDMWGIQEQQVIQVDGRTVVLPEFTAAQRRECAELVGGLI